MNITPKATPAMAQGPMNTNTSARAAVVAKIAAMQQATAPAPIPTQELPVRDANRVTAEEIGALAPSTQKHNNDTESKPAEESKQAEDPLSTQYAILARKEKALRARMQQQDLAAKAKEEAYLAREAELKAREQEYQSRYISKDSLTGPDALLKLQEAGLSYDKIVELAMNAPKPEELARMQYEKKIEAELKALKDEQLRTQKSFEDNEVARYTQALNHIRTEAQQLVSSDPQFETIKATGSVGEVVELIEQTFKQDGVLLTVEEAALEVENYLMEEGMKIARLTKIQQRLKPAEKPAEQKQTAQPQQQLKTLTNSVSSTRQLSARERALLAFKGELK